MHVMTKLLVALAAVLSVALATLTMAYAVNADRIVKEWRSERAAKEAALAAKDGAMAQFSDLRQQAELRIADLQNRLGDAEESLLTARGALSEAERAAITADQNHKTALTQVTTAQEMADTLTQIVNNQSAELRGLRDDDLRNRIAVRELTDRLNNIESQRQVLVSTVRAYEEQLADLQEQLELAQGPGRSTDGSGGGIVIPTSYYTGRVDEVSRDAGSNQTLVRLNLGSTDSVRRDTKLYITRGMEWIASVQVIEVDLNYSVARVLTQAPSKTIQPGDTVESRLQ